MNNGRKHLLTAVAASAVLSLSVLGLGWHAAAESHGGAGKSVATQWPGAQGSSVVYEAAGETPATQWPKAQGSSVGAEGV
ncbi:hypothetical protein GCM10009665_66640 [Kitasatospora nipponensis]|uniref:Uncharacterized protein n=1 Tax=Kitasatospora nipponensis TaxID=258049 RepID=A0ABN1WW24_9ACTN